MENLKDWQAWLNNISEPEWAAFMAQHGGEMDALRGGLGKVCGAARVRAA